MQKGLSTKGERGSDSLSAIVTGSSAECCDTSDSCDGVGDAYRRIRTNSISAPSKPKQIQSLWFIPLLFNMILLLILEDFSTINSQVTEKHDISFLQL